MAVDLSSHGSTDTVGQLVPFGPGQYTDPELARRERELVFGRVPSIVAHASELPEPNDFITLTMPRNRVIVARQQDGSVKAFVNVCRHRGAMLEEQASGRCRLFSCGYHRWSYNIDGSLRAGWGPPGIVFATLSTRPYGMPRTRPTPARVE